MGAGASVLHHQPGDLALQEAEAIPVDLVMAGWRHGTKRGRWALLFIVLLVYWYYLYTYWITYISSPTIICWWYLNLRVQHYQPGDLALQEVNCETVDLTLAG